MKHVILSPRPDDVLCGRGGRGGIQFDHRGNKTFRSLVSIHKEHYALCDNQEKQEIAKDIINTIKGFNPPGRFLKYNKISFKWEEINEKKTMKKTTQALRENQRYYKKAIEVLPLKEDKALEPITDEEMDFIVETFCRRK